jgi:hypothetical protein
MSQSVCLGVTIRHELHFNSFGLVPLGRGHVPQLSESHSTLKCQFYKTNKTKKNGVFYEVTSCGFCKNRHFGGTQRSSIRVTRIGELETKLATASVVTSSQIVTLMKEALRSSETSVPTRATRRIIPEHTILHSHRRENLKSYKQIKLGGF